MSRSKARTRSVKAEPPPASQPKGRASAVPSKVAALDKLNIFFAVFGAITVAAGLLSHALVVILLLGLAYVGTLIVSAIIEKSIKWPAWRIVIAFALMSGVIFLYYAPPRTESFNIDMQNFSGWPIVKPALQYYPVSNNPQTGQQYSNYELNYGNDYPVNVRCWTTGHLSRYPHVEIPWVSVKGGNFDWLWIPYEAVASGSPGLANDLPNCNSWWFKIWPF